MTIILKPEILIKMSNRTSVKTTTLGYYPGDEKIKITIGKEEVAELTKFPIPVYIFGIDETQEKGYLISANNLNSSLNINVMFK
jgi:hypothetical protein